MTIPTDTRQATIPARTHDLATLLRSRRSVRKYQSRPVAREQLEQILEAARWAPSPHGKQPWRFVVLTRPEVKAQLAAHMGQTWRANLEMDGQDTEIVNIRLEKSRQRIHYNRSWPGSPVTPKRLSEPTALFVYPIYPSKPLL